MITKNLIAGIILLDTYRDNPGSHDLSAEHDTVYLYSTNRPLSEEDVKKMEDLGFVQESTDSYDPDESWIASTDSYDPDESWIAYV